MLVLSRRLNEKIVFPGIDTAVQVVSVKPGLVRLGIEAPPNVTVLREELVGRDDTAELPPRLRRRLDAVHADLSLLRRQLTDDPAGVAEAILDKIEQQLRTLRQQVEPRPDCVAR